MADRLIEHLRKKGAEHSALALLVSQWGFDELLIPKALQAVGNRFPHYSRHDISHSRQILINIERFLGKDGIAELTGTDTWLILEAAYWHDIGMVVPQKHIEEDLNTEAFQLFIQSIRNDKTHDLNRFCKTFEADSLTTCFAGADNPVDAVSKFNELVAEWFRKKHPERAERIVQAPRDAAGISSPRTELIPNRLFRILGRICHLHGLDFPRIFSDLPHREAGLAQENCHPRFVACLLRSGDLLDIDDNRFCPVLQLLAGENRPALSKAHEDKHSGIRNLRLDQEGIEINAECKTIDGYLEAYRWFNWIDKELRDQKFHWTSIAPSPTMGLPPAVTWKASLNGEYQVLAAGERPQFTIDPKKIIELVQGSIYRTRFLYIRELLQNAVDATLLRLWLTNRDSLSSEIWEMPFSSEVNELLAKEFVQVELEQKPGSPGKTHWSLKITDQGTGISENDLKFMLRIGGSQHNAWRQQIIRSMPEWLKPSGAFGIGFQSAFLASDSVLVTTKNILTNEILELRLHSPLGSKDGLVLIKHLPVNIAQPSGTSLELNFECPAIPRSMSFNFMEDDTVVANVLKNVDPVLDSAIPYEAAQLADQITNFSLVSPIRIKGNLQLLDKRSYLLGRTSTAGEWSFRKVKDHQVALQYKPFPRSIGDINTRYRGQSFKSEMSHFPFLSIALNVMSGRADAWLTADRETLVEDAEDTLWKVCHDALYDVVKEDIDGARRPFNDERPYYSLFLNAMDLYYGDRWAALADSVGDAWMNLRVDEDGKTIRQHVEGKSELIVGQKIHKVKPSEDCMLLGTQWDDIMLKIILRHWVKQGGTTCVLEPELDQEEAPTLNSAHALRYHLRKEKQELYTPNALAARLCAATSSMGRNARFLLECPDDRWQTLHVDMRKGWRARSLFNIPGENIRYILLPFLFQGSRISSSSSVSTERLSELCEQIVPRLAVKTTKEEVRKEYDRLLEYLRRIVDESPYKELWDKAYTP